MCRIYGKEEQKKAVAAQVQELRKNASYYPIIARVLREFDGKVFNCRLEKALKEATENNVYVQKRMDWIEIYSFNRGAQYTLAQIRKDTMPDGKRICAADFIESAQVHRTAFLKKAADIERLADNMETVTAQLDGLKKAYNAIVDNMPYELRDIYGIDKKW